MIIKFGEFYTILCKKSLPSAQVARNFPLLLKSILSTSPLWPLREVNSHGCEKLCFDSRTHFSECFFLLDFRPEPETSFCFSFLGASGSAPRTTQNFFSEESSLPSYII